MLTLRSTALEDKGYHEIFEALFSVALSEKPVYYDKKKAQVRRNGAASRLSKCAAAVRAVASRGAARLGRKTLLAFIDHITQVLPGPNDDFVVPLLQDYVKALAEVLERASHVEFLARKDGAPWAACVDFLLDVCVYILPSELHSSVLASSRDSPTSGILTPWSAGLSTPAVHSQKRAQQPEASPLRDALKGLHCLVQAANAPVLQRAKDVTDLVLRVLGSKNLSLGPMQTVCFAIANTTFAAMQADDLRSATSLVSNLVPLASFWWRADKLSQDELIKALRNEISRTVFLTHLHIEHLAVNLWDDAVRSNLEDLVNHLWQEYSRRGEAFRLQFQDLAFATSSLPKECLQLGLFGLRNHNPEGEGHWAVVQNIALLEAALLQPSRKADGVDTDKSEQPQKRRRTRETTGHLRLRLNPRDAGVQRTALQLIPFIITTNALDVDETGELLAELVNCAVDKNPTTASWALVACARYVPDQAQWGSDTDPHSCVPAANVHEEQTDIWRQLWSIAVRSLSQPALCRGSCLLLQTLLDADVLPKHTLTADLNSFITTADVNGPAILCDTSISLMSCLLHERNVRLPSASQITSNQVIRWAFLKWNPSKLSSWCVRWLH